MGLKRICIGCRHYVDEIGYLLPENLTAYQVFLTCRRQWRMSWNGAYAIDGNFVWRILADRPIGNKEKVFSQVDDLANYYLDAVKR